MNDTQVVQTDVTLPMFDYSKLEHGALEVLIDCENELEAVLVRTHEEIGHILIRVKKMLKPLGGYELWCASQGISKTTAWRCVQAAEGKLDNERFKMKHLPNKHNYTSHIDVPKNGNRTQKEIEAQAFEACTKVMVYNRIRGVPVDTTWRPDGVIIGHDRKGNFAPVPDECIRELIQELSAYANENGL
jgi:hypothetical protein